jgi:hypothetical protein
MKSWNKFVEGQELSHAPRMATLQTLSSIIPSYQFFPVKHKQSE